LSLASPRLPWLPVLLLFSGCLLPVAQDVDGEVRELASHALDARAEIDLRASNFELRGPKVEEQRSKSETGSSESGASQPPPAKLEQRLQLPETLPGSQAELRLPPPGTPPEKRRQAILSIYPPLPPIEGLPPAEAGPFGHPLTLSELQGMARANGPVLRQAAAEVEAARAAVRQAGAYPNPSGGFEGDQMNSGGTAGLIGGFIEQLIKTAGKLKTAQASAQMSLAAAEVALRRVQSELATRVRSEYFALIVAHRTARWYEDLARYNSRVYEVSVEQLLGGLLAGYEPLQLRAFSMQARGLLTQARERYLSEWRQLAATLGTPGMPLTEVAGDPESAVPSFVREQTLDQVLNTHTDILTARYGLQKARYDLHGAQIAPIPDVDVRMLVQKDYTTPPFLTATTVQTTISLPIWDQNQGNIGHAQAKLFRASQEEERVRSELSARLADAFERYETNVALVRYYREKILPDLSRTYSRAVIRMSQQPIQGPQGQETSLNALDYLAHQQLYVAALQIYAGALRDQWQAVADIGGLLQLEDLFAVPVPHPYPKDGR